MTDASVTQPTDQPVNDVQARRATTLRTLAALIEGGLPAPDDVMFHRGYSVYLDLATHEAAREWIAHLGLPDPTVKAATSDEYLVCESRMYVPTGGWLGWPLVVVQSLIKRPKPQPVVLIESDTAVTDLALGDLVRDGEGVWRVVDEVRTVDRQVVAGMADTAEELWLDPAGTVRARREEGLTAPPPPIRDFGDPDRDRVPASDLVVGDVIIDARRRHEITHVETRDGQVRVNASGGHRATMTYRPQAMVRVEHPRPSQAVSR